MECEDAGAAEQSLVQAASVWLAACYPALLETRPESLLLEIDLVELAASQQHPLVVAALLENPERLRQAVIAALADADLLAPGQRVWLRPRQLLAAAELGVPAALECMRCAPGGLLASSGVCMGATALFQRPAARAFQCSSCSKACTLYSMAPPPPCCGGTLQEVEVARVMVPAQVVFLCDDSPLPSGPSTQLGGSVVAVHLADDLAGRVRIGDRVLVTGSGQYYGGGAALAPQAQLPVTLGVQMNACNVQVLQPTVMMTTEDLSPGAQQQLAVAVGGGLDGLLALLDAAVPEAAATASCLLKLGLLLSAAAAGTGSTQLAAAPEDDPEPTAVLRRRSLASRNQVNMMLTSPGPEPHIQRLLGTLSSMLCDHSVRGSASDPRSLLPTLDAKFVDPALGVAVPLGAGGQLAQAGGGVLLLSSSTLDTKRSIALGQFMAAGEVTLHPGLPELSVPVVATFWTAVHEQDLSKTGRAAAGLSLTERIINRYSHPFFCQHDILLSASPASEDEADMLADAILMSAASPPPAAGAAGRGRAAGALSALQQHIHAARAQQPAALSEEATALLSAYYQHLRTYEEAQQGLLASLLRVACAAARLRHSARVEAVPDAGLAVAFVEEKLLAAGASPLFWPRWREEMQRSTEVQECLRGLVGDCGAALLGLGVAALAGGCGGTGGDQMQEPEE